MIYVFKLLHKTEDRGQTEDRQTGRDSLEKLLPPPKQVITYYICIGFYVFPELYRFAEGFSLGKVRLATCADAPVARRKEKKKF